MKLRFKLFTFLMGLLKNHGLFKGNICFYLKKGGRVKYSNISTETFCNEALEVFINKLFKIICIEILFLFYLLFSKKANNWLNSFQKKILLNFIFSRNTNLQANHLILF